MLTYDCLLIKTYLHYFLWGGRRIQHIIYVGRNHPLKGHSLYVAVFLHQLTTDKEVPCTVFYRNICCVSFWTHFTYTSFGIKLKNDLLSAYMVLWYHCTIVTTLSYRLTLFSRQNLTLWNRLKKKLVCSTFLTWNYQPNSSFVTMCCYCSADVKWFLTCVPVLRALAFSNIFDDRCATTADAGSRL